MPEEAETRSGLLNLGDPLVALVNLVVKYCVDKPEAPPP
jgi:hypothetical protein